MKEKKLFTKMPKTTTIYSKDNISTFKGAIEKIYNDPTEIKLKKIARIIYDKLSSEDPNYAWQLEDYSQFKKIFSAVDYVNIDILGESIEKCLLYSTTEIYRELKKFGQYNDWYPPKDKLKDEMTNKYFYQEREIRATDCFYIATNLMGYMYQYIQKYAESIIELSSNTEGLIDIIKGVNQNTEEIEAFINGFDEKFSFTIQYPLFASIYLQIRNIILKKLTQEINTIYGRNQIKKNQKSYITPNFEGVKAGFYQIEHEKKYHSRRYLPRR